MVAELLSKIEKRAIVDILKAGGLFPNCSAWIVGGCLNRANSKDIDILIKTRKPIDFFDAGRFATDDYRIVSRHNQYDSQDSGKDLIAKMERRDGSKESRPIDLLFTSEQHMPGSIGTYMEKYFPLSIQMIAVNAYTGEVTDNSNPGGNILISPWVNPDAEYVQKYFDYYPNKVFYQVQEVRQLREVTRKPPKTEKDLENEIPF